MHVSVHLAKQFQRRFLEIDQSEYLLMDRDKMSNLYRGPSIDASYSSFGSFGQTVSKENFV
jgi:hypothetical protein